MKNRKLGIAAVIVFALAAPFVASAADVDTPAPAPTPAMDAACHQAADQSAAPAACCQAVKADGKAMQCEMNPQAGALLQKLAKQEAFDELMAEIDAWQADLNADYE